MKVFINTLTLNKNKIMPKVLKKQNTTGLTPEQKILAGLKWTIHIDVDADVAYKIIEQKKNSPPGTEFKYLFNKALRKGLSLKTNK